MSGHSKWANIKRKKSKVDEERGKVFTKISRELAVAVRQGGPDPDGNFRLKLIIQKAKAANMPNDNIKRCIQKAAGGTEGTQYDEITYEGYGPAGTALFVEIMTDNRNRTASEMRYIFSRNNGNIGAPGCVAWMFDKIGRITVPMEGLDEDEVMMVALEAGADDFSVDSSDEENVIAEIVTTPDNLEAIRQALEDASMPIAEAEITRVPQNTVVVDNLDDAKQVLKLYDLLDEHDDVQNVYSNFEIPDDIMEQID